MKVLVACEWSGTVREAFKAKGHEAWSCDLDETAIPGNHIRKDVRKILWNGWDMMIAFPPCTYLCVSGYHRTVNGLRDKRLTEHALDLVRSLLTAPIEYIALENPVGIISSYIRKPDQIIQPYKFGEPESKKTCLWLKNLPRLKPTRIAGMRIVNGTARFSNQTDSGQNKLTPDINRDKERGKTYQGIASAMAEQWSNL